MKKIITLFAILGAMFISSCEGPEGPPGRDGSDAAMPLAFEIKNVNMARFTDNEYNFKGNINSYIKGDLFDDETILVYRLTGLVNSNTPIWQLIPRTTYFDNGDIIDYYFDFSKVDFVITAHGSFNLAEEPSYVNSQTFRVVISPSNLSASVNKNNYNEVISALKLKESEVKKIDF